MKFIGMLLTASICATALIGDYIVFKSKYSESQVFRSFADSGVHASIGFLSALLFFTYDIGITEQARIYNIAFCTILSSLIDVDHFIAAKSFRLKVSSDKYFTFFLIMAVMNVDLTHLKQRGILHCTTLWFSMTLVLLIYSCLVKKLNVYILTYMAILAYTSHHVRDANRRGLWFFPYGHTPPLTKYFYIFLLAVLPRLIAYLYALFKPIPYRNTVIYYEAVG